MYRNTRCDYKKVIQLMLPLLIIFLLIDPEEYKVQI